MTKPTIWAIVAACWLIMTPGLRAAGSASALAAARASITSEQLRQHAETLAGDAFEGREAGRRGGQAAGMYIMRALREAGLRPAGTGGTYFQEFGPGYRNILAWIPGADPKLSREYLLVTAHYDHVGYGNRRNSNGPVGYIHNGADDNASGVATLLEVAEALGQHAPSLGRSILFVLWDAEEKGLLGSLHWLNQPTIDLGNVRLLVNLDMVGRLRDDTLSVIGSRSMPGLRAAWSRANVDGALRLEFPWEMLDNSDHFPFFERRLPVSMLHTGLHDQYHRPSDDPHLLNVEGIQAVSLLTLNFLVDVGNQPRLAEFRPRSISESTPQQAEFERPPAQRPMRLGVAWEPRSAERGGGLLVRSVWTGTPADQAGVAPGDVIAAFNGRAVTSAEQLRSEVIKADAPVELEIERDGQRSVKRVELAGSPTRVGISWRSSDAEPGAVILSGVLAGSPAAVAGLRRLDRIHAVDGHEFAASEAFRELISRAGGRVQLLIERSGRMRLVDLELPDAETSDS